MIDHVDASNLIERIKDKRARDMIVMRVEGHSFKEIGEAHGVSQVRVQQIIEREFERIRGRVGWHR